MNPIVKTDPCPYCQKHFGNRALLVASDGLAVHKMKCFQAYEDRIKVAQRAQRKANEDAEQAERKLVREHLAELRGGSLGSLLAQDVESLPQDEMAVYWFVMEISGSLKSAQKIVAKFSQELADETRCVSHTMESSMRVFNAAATVAKVPQLLEHIFRGCPAADIVSTLQDDVLREARSPSRSTSPTSNLMEQEILATNAGMLEKISNYLKRRR